MREVTHIVIPDSQVKPGVPTKYLDWIGRYIVDHFAGRPDVKIIHLGDFADMASLSSYDKGKKAMEGRRYVADIEAANAAWKLLNRALEEYNAHKRQQKHTQWWPERYITLGNHEDRITRATELDPQLEGVISLDDLDFGDWTVIPFLEPLNLDGVIYSHYFYNPMTGRPYGGTAITRLKQLGHSFTMGHQQTYDIAVRFVGNQQQRGLICGACYLHDEEYRGPQGNWHFRGIFVCHEVEDGAYNLMEVSLDYLCRRYEGVSLSTWLKRHGLGTP